MKHLVLKPRMIARIVPKTPFDATENLPLESEVSKRAWWTDGVGARKPLAQGNPSHRSRPFFCTLFPMLPYQQESTILRDNFCCILGAVGRQPPPANPFSKPLMERRAIVGSQLSSGMRQGVISKGEGSFY